MPATEPEALEDTRSLSSLEARFESAMRDLFDRLPPARRGELFKEILLECNDGASPDGQRPAGPPEWEEAIAAYDAARAEEDLHEGQSLEYEDSPVLDWMARSGDEGAAVVHGRADTEEELNEGQSLEYEDAPLLDARAVAHCGNNTGRAHQREDSPSTEPYDDQENCTTDGGFARRATINDDSDVEMTTLFTRESTAASGPESYTTDDHTSDIYHQRRHSVADPTLCTVLDKAPAGHPSRAQYPREWRIAPPARQPRARSLPAAGKHSPAVSTRTGTNAPQTGRAPSPDADSSGAESSDAPSPSSEPLAARRTLAAGRRSRSTRPGAHDSRTGRAPSPDAGSDASSSAGEPLAARNWPYRNNGGPCLYAGCAYVAGKSSARLRHMDEHPRPDRPIFVCPTCARTFTRFYTLQRHRRPREARRRPSKCESRQKLSRATHGAALLAPGAKLRPWVEDVRGLRVPHPNDPLRDVFRKAHPSKEQSSLKAEDWEQFCA